MNCSRMVGWKGRSRLPRQCILENEWDFDSLMGAGVPGRGNSRFRRGETCGGLALAEGTFLGQGRGGGERAAHRSPGR